MKRYRLCCLDQKAPKLLNLEDVIFDDSAMLWPKAQVLKHTTEVVEIVMMNVELEI